MMNFTQADEILHKYDLVKKANEEFEWKTRNDTGKMNVGLRLRICAEHMERKAREFEIERKQVVKNNPEKCPNFEIEKKENPFAHDDCGFICIVPRKFCHDCGFYIKNVKSVDDSIKELYEAAKVFRYEANYDDIWQ